MKTALIHSDAWARFDYGPQHPLRMERLGLTWRLMQAYGPDELPGATVLDAEPADERQIGVFHAPEYLASCRRPTAARRRRAAASSDWAPATIPSSRAVGSGAAGGGGLADGRRLVAARRGRSRLSTSPAACIMRCPGARPASAT
jgi:acetoin utilization deacetylase AcuC-like enzyme